MNASCAAAASARSFLSYLYFLINEGKTSLIMFSPRLHKTFFGFTTGIIFMRSDFFKFQDGTSVKKMLLIK